MSCHRTAGIGASQAATLWAPVANPRRKRSRTAASIGSDGSITIKRGRDVVLAVMVWQPSITAATVIQTDQLRKADRSIRAVGLTLCRQAKEFSGSCPNRTQRTHCSATGPRDRPAEEPHRWMPQDHGYRQRPLPPHRCREESSPSSTHGTRTMPLATRLSAIRTAPPGSCLPPERQRPDRC